MSLADDYLRMRAGLPRQKDGKQERAAPPPPARRFPVNDYLRSGGGAPAVDVRADLRDPSAPAADLDFNEPRGGPISTAQNEPADAPSGAIRRLNLNDEWRSAERRGVENERAAEEQAEQRRVSEARRRTGVFEEAPWIVNRPLGLIRDAGEFLGDLTTMHFDAPQSREADERWQERARTTGDIVSGIPGFVEQTLDSIPVEDTTSARARGERDQRETTGIHQQDRAVAEFLRQRGGSPMADDEGLSPEIVAEVPRDYNRPTQQILRGVDEAVGFAADERSQEGEYNYLALRDAAQQAEQMGDAERAADLTQQAQVAATGQGVDAGFAAMEMVPGVGAIDLAIAPARAGARGAIRAAGHEAPEFLRAPAHSAPDPAPLTREARDWRDAAVVSGSGAAIAGAADEDVGLGDGPVAPAVAGGAILAAMRPGALARGAREAAPVVARETEQALPRLQEGVRTPESRAPVDVEASPAPSSEGAIQAPLRSLRTPDEQQSWANEALVHIPPDRAEPNAHVYGFRGPNGAEMAVTIKTAPDAPDRAWIDLENLSREDPTAPLRRPRRGSGQERYFSTEETQRVIERAAAAIGEDARSRGLGVYEIFSADPTLARAYRMRARNIEPPAGYTVELDGDTIRIVRGPDAPPPQPSQVRAETEATTSGAIRSMPLMSADLDIPRVPGQRQHTVKEEVARLSEITDENGLRLSASQIASRLRTMGYDRASPGSVRVIQHNLRRGRGDVTGAAVLAGGLGAGALAFGAGDASAEGAEALADGRKIVPVGEGVDLRTGDWMEPSWQHVVLADGSEGLSRTILGPDGRPHILVARQGADASIDVLGEVRPETDSGPRQAPQFDAPDQAPEDFHLPESERGGAIQSAAPRERNDAETPDWALAVPAVAAIVGGRLGRRLGEQRGRALLYQGAGGAAGGAIGGAAAGALTEADDMGELAGLGAIGGAVLPEAAARGASGGRQLLNAAADIPARLQRQRVRGEPIEYIGAIRPTQNAERVTGSLDEAEISGEMRESDFPPGAFDPQTGKPLFGTPRRQRTQVQRPPLDERAAQSGAAGAMQGVPALTLRRIAEDLGIEAGAVKAADLRRSVVRNLAQRFDSTRELVAFLARYGVSGTAIGIAASSDSSRPTGGEIRSAQAMQR